MEEDIKVQICRLCFSLISDNSFLHIIGSLKDMLQVITSDLNLDVTDSPVMCSECSKSVQDLFSFKTNFFESEEKIEGKVVDKDVKLDLADVMTNSFRSGLRRRPSKVKFEKLQMCRLCLRFVKHEGVIPLNKGTDIVLALLLDTCLSELDLNLTSDPVMCTNCYEVLQRMYVFKTMCTENECKIMTFLKTLGADYYKKINLHSIIQFLSNSESKSDIPAIKTECIKSEELVRNVEKSEVIEDCLGYVTVKIEPDDRDVKTEPDSCLKLTKVKEESIERQCIIAQKGSITDKSLVELNKSVDENELILSNKSQKLRHSKETTQNRAADGDTTNTIHCPYCNFKTKYGYNLRRHLLAFHKCHLAGETVQRNFKVKRKHYQCPHCDFSVRYNIDLTRHMLSHVKPEAFQCKRCPYSTNQNSYLVKHILSHVNDDNKDKHSLL